MQHTHTHTHTRFVLTDWSQHRDYTLTSSMQHRERVESGGNNEI